MSSESNGDVLLGLVVGLSLLRRDEDFFDDSVPLPVDGRALGVFEI